MSGTLLRVAEMFGPTFQGEGPAAGQRAVFVRLSGCPLSCRWCDTPYTWDRSRFDLQVESRYVEVDDVVSWVRGIPSELVVVTGGEPLLQQEPLAALACRLVAEGRRVEVETSGTLVPSGMLTEVVTRFVVSPKLANSGLPLSRRIRPEALKSLVSLGTAVFKFVVCGVDDLDEVAALEADHALAPIWIMPEGTSENQVHAGLRSVADSVLSRGWHVTSRLHVILWGDQRGR